jgi:D-alanine-D-alanine ligase
MLQIVIISGGSKNEFDISLRSGYDISSEIFLNNTFKFFNVIILPNKKLVYSNNYNTVFIDSNKIDTIKVNPKLDEIFQIGNGKINNIKIDCAILTTHGINGEDGKLQGFLDMNKIPYIGCDVLGSAICMDKEVSKILVKSVGINVLPWLTFHKNDDINIDNILNNFGKKLVVKTTNSGSSNGVFLANKDNLSIIIKKAFELNDKIIIEQEFNIKELEISFIGNEYSDIGEIIKDSNFYDYKMKYLGFTKLNIPADINDSIKNKIINDAKIIKHILNLKNFSRIDFFLINNVLYFNEVNTLPGFQRDSMFPNLWYSKKFTFIDIIKKIVLDSIKKI